MFEMINEIKKILFVISTILAVPIAVFFMVLKLAWLGGSMKINIHYREGSADKEGEI